MLTYLLHLITDVIAPGVYLLMLFVWALFAAGWKLGWVKTSFTNQPKLLTPAQKRSQQLNQRVLMRNP